jgi:hypothetical protein
MSRTLAHLLLCLLSVLAVPSVFADASDPAAQSALLPSPSESGMPEKIARKEVRRIRREFTDLLDQERGKLRAEQSRKRRDGEANRKASRRKFFEANTHGPERRQYVKDFNERRIAFYESLKAEEKLERIELDARWKALKESQRNRLTIVEEYLRRSERPLSKYLVREE